MTAPPPPKTGEGIEGRVVYRENSGSDLFLHVEVQGVSASLIARVDPTTTFAIGDPISLAIDPRYALLFDANGKRVRP